MKIGLLFTSVLAGQFKVSGHIGQVIFDQVILSEFVLFTTYLKTIRHGTWAMLTENLHTKKNAGMMQLNILRVQ